MDHEDGKESDRVADRNRKEPLILMTAPHPDPDFSIRGNTPREDHDDEDGDDDDDEEEEEDGKIQHAEPKREEEEGGGGGGGGEKEEGGGGGEKEEGGAVSYTHLTLPTMAVV